MSGAASENDNSRIAEAVREALARQRMSRAALAAKARISLSSLEKTLSGQRPFTMQSIVRLEEALGVILRRQAAAQAIAPEALGSYARPAVTWLLGRYITLRPSFSDPAAIYAYLTEITWDDALGHLVFRESERRDEAFTQQGHVALPHQSGHVYLVTNKHGQHRLAILSRPTIAQEMYGLLSTLVATRGAQLMPVSMPMALVPLAAGHHPLFGKIEKSSAVYAGLRAHLDKALAQEFCALIRPEA